MCIASLLPHQLLDLLVDGPSSFAALYSAANRLYPRASERRYSVGEIWDVLASIEKVGWTKARRMLPAGTWEEPTDLQRVQARRQYQDWLPGADFGEMSVDEVGLWFEIEPRGRTEWSKWAEASEGFRTWVLDQDPEMATITVHAENLERADQALAEWLAHHPEMEVVPESRMVQPSPGFQLRNERFVQGGVHLCVAYRVTHQVQLPAGFKAPGDL